MGIYAAGGEVMLDEVNISGVEMGVKVEKGTLKILEGTQIHFMGEYGVKLGSGVKSADLRGTTIRGDGSGGTGIYVMGGGTLEMTLDGVTVSGVQMGITMMSGALDVKERTTIDFEKNGWGIYMRDGVTSASLTGTSNYGKGKWVWDTCGGGDRDDDDVGWGND
ncbi:right-handed parallel beta-helix repeat-containing protein [Bartonella schoenbuchensis]|uniref:Right handed beta helix domain-containing protein n=1 Tax=Bartonella schoenbuchensis m07a TaxID=1094496 RepID=N6VFY5_9HYPH|nr:right-handed parallel beta-helix repeat-containing protein [Bartonella schoenbuchensis]ENN92675.1 hypothetical protein m07a_01860 [Bartonella schoenbuchensis m07a]